VPVYDYICSSCSHRFEVFRGLNEAGPSQCPLCAGPVTRAFAPPTIHFKGSGWAKMDRRTTGAPAKKAAPAEGEGVGSKGGEAVGGEAKGGGSKGGEAKDGASTSRGTSSGEPTSVGPASRESTSAASPSTSSGNGD
jgi:putative FmdB family regulatory protein